jgi:CheY-like chemotaxis protein
MRVLAIDDEELMLDVLARMLRGHAEVAVASSGEDALVLIDGGAEFDVILCDLSMPGMSGMDVHAELRQRGGLDVRVLFVTGGATNDRAARFLEEMRERVVFKPVSQTVLLDRIRRLTQAA